MVAHQDVKQSLKQVSNPEKAAHSAKFFKAYPGGYGQGDQFLGIPVPQQRTIAKKMAAHTTLNTIQQLLRDPIHECRLTALFMLTIHYQKRYTSPEECIKTYKDHLNYVNNWDLVDASAYKLLGHYLETKARTYLYDLAESGDLWRERVAVIATYHFIQQHDFKDTLQLCYCFLSHPHDLMHKATGWMLREVGKRDQSAARAFLEQHSAIMPRTMLRYAIERYDQATRKAYLSCKFR